jgi:hypothetical protein
MSVLSKKLTQFDKEDVNLLDEMLSKFHALKGERGGDLPDFSPSYIAYFPVLTLALLKAQRVILQVASASTSRKRDCSSPETQYLPGVPSLK